MLYLLYTFVFLSSFVTMEFVAWFAHKYVMHGSFWFLHKDHHDESHKILQKNDSFALVFAIPSWLCIMLGVIYGSTISILIGSGIAAFGFSYFMVHDVFIHQRIKYFRNSDNWYLRALRKAHRIHHKKLTREEGECFGMLFVPMKYFKEELKKN